MNKGIFFSIEATSSTYRYDENEKLELISMSYHITTNISNEAEAEKLVDCLLRCLGVIRQGLCFSLSLNREAYYYSASVSFDDYFLNDEVLIFSSELENVQKMTEKQQTDLLEQARERGRTELSQIQLN